jgi:hypothetical protein
MPIHNWGPVDANLFHDFHQTWTIGIRNALSGGLLPKGYSALVESHVGEFVPDVHAQQRGNHITIRHPLGRVVCVIEIVSPGNMGSRSALKSFVEKTIDFLRQGVNIVVIHLFSRRAATHRGSTSRSGTRLKTHRSNWLRKSPLPLPPTSLVSQ